MSDRITIIEQDITTVTNGIVCHQVNCRGRMGSGVALSIAKKWPIVEREYRYLCDRTHPLHKNLGECQIVEIHSPLFVCNIFGQDGYGSPKDGKQYTNYEAVEQAFSTLGKITRDVDDLNFYLQTAYIPWMMGLS